MKSSRSRPNLPPVQRIQVSGTHTKLRWILIVILLAVAAVSLTVGLMSLLGTESGWQEVEVTSSRLHCGSDFVLRYEYGAAGISASAEAKQLTELYSRAVENAYDLFSVHAADPQLSGLSYLNAHVNETVTVDPALYQALTLVDTHGSRLPYLAAVYTEYNRLFLCENEDEAVRYDPAQNSELQTYVRQLAAYANDPQMITVELNGNDQVCLRVSQAYLDFAEENGIEAFLDFGWMKNAFIADYLAQQLTENGFTNGYLASFDGFTRNLDSRDTGYSLNLFDRYENSIYLPAVMEYRGGISIVSLRNYPMSQQDAVQYYTFSSGRIVAPYIDPADGMCASATDNLVAWSASAGCAEIALQTAPVFVAQTLSEDALNALTEGGIYSIWSQGAQLRYNDQALQLQLQSTEGITYTTALVTP